MYFHRKLHKIRQKPPHVKDRIVVVCMAIAVSLVATFWLGNFDFSGLDPRGAGKFFSYTKSYFSNADKNIFTSELPDNYMDRFTGTSTGNKSIVASSTATSSSQNADLFSEKNIIDTRNNSY